LKTIGHSLKNLGLSQKTLRHPWCPELVTGLFIETTGGGGAKNFLREAQILHR